MEEHHGREVGDQVGHVPRRGAAEAGDHAVGGEHLEVVGVLVDEREFCPLGTYSKVWILCLVEYPERRRNVRRTVKNNILLVIREFSRFGFGLLCLLNVV